MIVTAVVVIPDELVEKAKGMGMPYIFIQTELGRKMGNSFREYLQNEDVVLSDLEIKHKKHVEEVEEKSMVDSVKEMLEDKEAMDYFEKRLAVMSKKGNIYLKQVKRLHQKFEDLSQDQFEDFIDKVLQKYDSEEYVRRWYGRGIEPERELLYYLHAVAEKHGKEANRRVWQDLSNPFTQSINVYKKHAFMFIMGQGSGVIVFRKEGKDWKRL
jgi:replicative superfamily II helicase